MDSNRKGMAIKEQMTDEFHRSHTTIGLKTNTKGKLDKKGSRSVL